MSKYTDQLSAEELISYIARDCVELSHDKVRWQRDDFMKICRDWLEVNCPPDEEGRLEQFPDLHADLDF